MFTKNRLILILGIWVALMPFLGFPSMWKNCIYIISGLAISTLSFLIARHKRISRRPVHKKDRKEIVQSEPVLENEVPHEEEFLLDSETEPVQDVTEQNSSIDVDSELSKEEIKI